MSIVDRMVDELTKRVVSIERDDLHEATGSQAAYRAIELSDDDPLEIYNAEGVLIATLGENGLTLVTAPSATITPTAPNVYPQPGGVVVVWDGTFTDGTWEDDAIKLVEIHAVTTLVGLVLDDTTQIGSFLSSNGGEFLYSISDTAGARYYILQAVNQADEEGAGSVPVQATALPIVSVDEFNTTVDAIEGDLQATYEAITGGVSPLMGQIAAALANYQSLYGSVDAQIDDAIADFNAGLATKSKHTLSTAAPTTNSSGNAGDVWEQKNGTGKIIGRWRLMNSASPYQWDAMDLSATYIPQIDIGTGTFGDLDGERLLAKSVGAEAMLVTDFTNYAMNGDFETGVSAPHYGPAANANWTTGIGTSDPASGKYHAELTVTTAFVGGIQWILTNGNTNAPTFHPLVREGETWVFKYKAKVDAGDTIRVRPGFIVRSKNDVSVNVHTAYSTYETPSPAGQYVTRTWETTIPTGLAAEDLYMIVQLAVENGSVGDHLRLDDMELRRKFGGELIVDGSILAKHVAADSISVKHLVVSNFDNLLSDPKFLLPINEGWTQFNSIATNGNQEGTGNAGVLSPNASIIYPVAQPAWEWQTENGKAFRLRLRFHTDIALNAGAIYLRMRFFATDGTYTDVTAGTSPAAGAGTWNTVEGIAVTPSTKTYTRCGFFFQASAHPTQTIKIAEPSVTRAADASLIVDGSVYARHITADMVNALLLTGSAIQTTNNGPPSSWSAPGGANPPTGIKISDAGLVGYSAGGAGAAPAGTPVTTISTATGRIAAVGGFDTATGYDDVRITAGNSTTPSAVQFISDGTGLDNNLPASVSMFDGTQPLGGVNSYYTTLTLQGGKYASAGTRARIDFTTWRHVATPTNVQADIAYHAGKNGAMSGAHYFYIDGSLKAHVNSSELKSYVGFYDNNYYAGGSTGASIDNTGRIVRTGSSMRYKQGWETLSLEEAQIVLAMESGTFQWRPEMNMGERRFPGFNAEQAHEAGATLWVTYDDDDEAKTPSGIRYPELTAAHNVLIRDLYQRVEALEGLR